MPRTLLTFAGSHDPYHGPEDGERPIGPILTAIEYGDFERVVLIATPKMSERTYETEVAINERYPKIGTYLHELDLKDPTNYATIIAGLREIFREVDESITDPEYVVATASGTPQMHACWLLLTQSGEIPATVIQTHPPQFLQPGESPVKIVDIGSPEFPRINPGFTVGADEELSIGEACRKIGIIGDHPLFIDTLEKAANLASFDQNILLLGENGSGKELFRKLIAAFAKRPKNHVETVNCAGLTEQLIDGQLFGYTKGAFTGAIKDTKGHFAKADQGVLFLDELGEIPVALQAKLLRAIENGEIQPLGEAAPVKVDVMLVAATNRDLTQMVEDGDFRMDLYQRFASRITIPPLRDRPSDIPLLANFFLDQWSRRHDRGKSFTPSALRALQEHPWVGNVRELQSTVTNAAINSRGKTTLEADDIPFDRLKPKPYLPTPGPGFSMENYLQEQKRLIVQRALEQANGVKAHAAANLGITPQAIGQYLKRNQDSE